MFIIRIEEVQKDDTGEYSEREVYKQEFSYLDVQETVRRIVTPEKAEAAA